MLVPYCAILRWAAEKRTAYPIDSKILKKLSGSISDQVYAAIAFNSKLGSASLPTSLIASSSIK